MKALRDRRWEERLPTLEQQALESQSERVDQLLASAKPLAAARGFAIDIKPSGEPEPSSGHRSTDSFGG